MKDEFLRRVDRVTKVTDGDTFEFDIDLGYRHLAREAIRLRGFNAAELNEAEGPLMQQRAKELLGAAQEIYVRSYKNSNDNDVRTFTRYVGDVYVNGASLADLLTVHLVGLRRNK